jgi:hypothetical protein
MVEVLYSSAKGEADLVGKPEGRANERMNDGNQPG